MMDFYFMIKTINLQTRQLSELFVNVTAAAAARSLAARVKFNGISLNYSFDHPKAFGFWMI